MANGVTFTAMIVGSTLNQASIRIFFELRTDLPAPLDRRRGCGVGEGGELARAAER